MASDEKDIISPDFCILCLEVLLKHTDRNFVKGKADIEPELNDLPFVVSISSTYICKKCLALIKRRRSLKEKLNDIDLKLTSVYRSKLASKGIAMKTRSCAAKKMRFDGHVKEEYVPTDGDVPVNWNQHDNTLVRY